MTKWLFALSIASFVACSGPPIPSPIEGEPVCSDFQLTGATTTMRGGLRFPVTVTIKDGADIIGRATVYGRRTERDAQTRILVRDDDDEYTIDWAQCENQRAPAPAKRLHEDKDAAQYECGKGTVYKTEMLKTRKGDPASRKITFPPPPNAACWTGEPAAPSIDADAGAPADAGTSPSADENAADAGTALDAATDASSDAATPSAAAEDASVKASATPDAAPPRDAGADPRAR